MRHESEAKTSEGAAAAGTAVISSEGLAGLQALLSRKIVHHDARAGKSSPSSSSRRQSTGDVSDEKAKKRKKKPRPSMPEVGGDGGLE